MSISPCDYDLAEIYCSPESADTSHMHVEDGDLILLATDGVFDNLPDSILVTELRKVSDRLFYPFRLCAFIYLVPVTV